MVLIDLQNTSSADSLDSTLYHEALVLALPQRFVGFHTNVSESYSDIDVITAAPKLAVSLLECYSIQSTV